MTDREKVIKGLECCSAMSGDVYRKCPWSRECLDTNLPYGTAHLANDALALLREQEPRVIEFLEISEATTYWMEDNCEANRKTACIPETVMDIMGDRVFTIPVVKLLNGYAPVISKNREGYGKTWRAWTSRPTPEQMRETPWGVTENG